MESVATSVPLEEALSYDGMPFPLCLSPKERVDTTETDVTSSRKSITEWGRENAALINSALREHGSIMFRGFKGPGGSTLSPALFGEFVEALGWENFPYVGGNAVRTSIPNTNDRVFTANESPPEKPIPFHHELAQTPVYPARLLFFCERPAEAGGETPILLSTKLLESLVASHPEFVRDLQQHGVRYSRVMTREDRATSAIGRGWAATFNVDTRAEAEAVLASRGYEWKWLDRKDPSSRAAEGDQAALLRETSPVLPAVRAVDEGDENGPRAFFNQLLAVWGGWRDEFNTPSACVSLGNGRPLNPEAMDSAIRVAKRHTVTIPWRAGDIMAIDNYQVQHSRSTFSGPRRVLASLTK